MTEEQAQIIHVFTEPVSSPTASWCVDTLEGCGGNIKKWLSQHPQNRIGDEELVIARTQQWLASLPDKKLLARWEAAKRQNRAVRLELILEKSLERLESLLQTDDGWAKMKNEAAAHKLALGTLLTREAQAAKRGDVVIEDDEEEDEDAEAAANY